MGMRDLSEEKERCRETPPLVGTCTTQKEVEWSTSTLKLIAEMPSLASEPTELALAVSRELGPVMPQNWVAELELVSAKELACLL